MKDLAIIEEITRYFISELNYSPWEKEKDFNYYKLKNGSVVEISLYEHVLTDVFLKRWLYSSVNFLS